MRNHNMSLQFQGSDRMLKLPQSDPSSAFSTRNYAYAYIISSPSDAVDGPKAKAAAMNMEETINSIMTESESWEDHIPVAQPWPESKPTLHTEEYSSPPSLPAPKEEDDGVDTPLKVVVESLRDLYRESETIFKKVFFKKQQMKAGMLQRSLSVDSPRTPLGRFKIKTLDLGGGGGGVPDDIK